MKIKVSIDGLFDNSKIDINFEKEVIVWNDDLEQYVKIKGILIAQEEAYKYFWEGNSFPSL